MITELLWVLATAATATQEAPVPAWAVYLLVGGYVPCGWAIWRLYVDLQKSQKGRLNSLKRMRNLLGNGDDDESESTD